ncbi:MAG TPA: response regulator [Dictyobacter sp.]|jgi:CheY-like chemotaxis protein/predicted regulator of Ras-like GTPase activity (Roadblock/LC7/MglB family)|nr:response regulator [Dictyobacter sp.]
MMSDVWRIFIVEADESLNQNLVTSLHKDGYDVHSVVSGPDAVRALWAEEYNVVIYDLSTPGTDGFELLEWLRAYRPGTHMMMIGEVSSTPQRMQALEGGAASYFEKPLDLRALREELRRVLQQTGFSASLDSFDLLDVIQIITMSRKSIALLIHIGVEERGILCFKTGELVWAEYGVLRGEEAFFALAAHKNGTVTQQAWDENVVSNVTQPLSRLIFQALQYRTKYANSQQYSGEIEPVRPVAQQPPAQYSDAEYDDSPFVFTADGQQSPLQPEQPEGILPERDFFDGGESVAEKEWWEKTGQYANVTADQAPTPKDVSDETPTMAMDANALRSLLQDMRSSNNSTSPVVQPTASTDRMDLPSWLIDQASSTHLPAVNPSLSAPAVHIPAIPSTPELPPSSMDWSMKQDNANSQNQSDTSVPPLWQDSESMPPIPSSWLIPATPTSPSQVTPAWEEQSQHQGESSQQRNNNSMSGILPGNAGNIGNTMSPFEVVRENTPRHEVVRENTPRETAEAGRVAAQHNYTTLIAALQSLGYSVPGFIATAILTSDGQPVAQVAADGIDISKMSKYFSTIQKSALLVFDQGEWGEYRDTILTSAKSHIMMRVVGNPKKIFHVLVTSRASNPTASLQMMSNIEESISSVLR